MKLQKQFYAILGMPTWVPDQSIITFFELSNDRAGPKTMKHVR
jgi:hypothetical protein